MKPDVCRERGPLRERLGAQVTLVWPLPGVGAHVGHQVPLDGAGHGAVRTLERLLARVGPHVAHQVVPLVEHHRAQGTRVERVAAQVERVDAHVVGHADAAGEAHGTHGAAEQGRWVAGHVAGADVLGLGLDQATLEEPRSGYGPVQEAGNSSGSSQRTGLPASISGSPSDPH